MFFLNFHGLGKPPGQQARRDDLYWIDPKLFAQILEAARDRPDVHFTFDDSYESDYEIALPLLKASKMTARFFVLAGRVGSKGYLSARQVQSLCAEGMTIGNHGMDHREWPCLDNRQLDEEVIEARDRLEQIVGSAIVEAACPFGSYDRRVLKRLRMSGYEKVYTSDGGPTRAEAWIQPRNTIVRDDNLQRVLHVISETRPGPISAFRGVKLALKRWR